MNKTLVITTIALVAVVMGISAVTTSLGDVAGIPDLSIIKTDNPDPVNPGDQLTYTITVNREDTFPNDAFNVVVTDTLPADVTFVSTTGCAEDPNGVPTCSLGAISAGGSASYTITVTVNFATSGTLTNTVSVTSDSGDTNPSNNIITEDTTIEPGAPSTPQPPEEPGPPEETPGQGDPPEDPGRPPGVPPGPP